MALIGLDKAKVFSLGQDLLVKLARLLAVFIACDFFFILCEVLTMGYSGGDMELEILAQMTSGATAPYFWFEIIGGLLIPFIMMAIPKVRERRGAVVCASVLVMLGVLCKRAWLLFSSFLPVQVDGGPGVSLGTFAAQTGTYYDVWATGGMYTPTWTEVVIVCGVVALGVLAFILLANGLLRGGKGDTKAEGRTAEAAA